jgi:glycosyltransferase involved in cell wall biosynthesis
MKILIVNPSIIPVKLYGGTERVIWYLGKELAKIGHEVFYLVKPGSYCDFAKIIAIDETRPIIEQIPSDIDLVHFQFTPDQIDKLSKPYIITIHGNSNDTRQFELNTVFVSQNHAARFGSEAFVHNGLDWNDYSVPNLSMERKYFHFLGNAAWRVKNVKGAIKVVQKTKHEHLNVLGGVRFNLKMGLRFTFSPRIHFYGMIGENKKDELLNQSKGLLFPVRWHEPFGLAIIESLYYGCPVFGTPYGALPELIKSEFGFLSANANDLSQALQNINSYSRKACHDYAVEQFNSKKMAEAYVNLYTKVLNGHTINSKAPQLINIQLEKFLPWEE